MLGPASLGFLSRSPSGPVLHWSQGSKSAPENIWGEGQRVVDTDPTPDHGFKADMPTLLQHTLL